MHKLRGLDLNLVVALDALLAEHNVTRAARRVGLSQPAMSHALARLRAVTGDPLLVRARGRMVPTPVAIALGKATGGALRQLEQALGEHPPFEPATSTRTFTIAASDYTALVLVAPLVQELARAAPAVSIRTVPIQADLSLDDLESGAVDLTMGYFRRAPASLHRLHLFDDRFVLVMRRGHPASRGTLTPAGFAALRSLVVAPQGSRGRFLDDALAARGLRRHVAWVAPQFLAALGVVHGDLVCALPERLARALAELAPIAVVPLPFPVKGLDVSAYWHERVHHDAAHAWLRGRLAAQAKVAKKR